MGFEADDEILQDFLVEAGEILEQLSEQLVDLENRPDDKDLLNAIFRGFHTVKGGAGFLQLTELVDCCHAAENVFDTLRNGHRRINADLMDTVLQALDAVNEMFSRVHGGQSLVPADPHLIETLHYYAHPESEDEVNEAPAAEPAEQTDHEPVSQSEPQFDTTDTAEDSASLTSGTPGDDITDAEFEQLLDAIAPPTADSEAPSTETTDQAAVSTASSSDEITEDEFEALLDQLHGKGKFKASVDTVSTPVETPSTTPEPSSSVPEAASSDEITDDEFEALLDQLHGKGQFKPTAVAGSPAPPTDTTVATSEPKPVAPVAQEKPAIAASKPAEPQKPAAPPPPPRKPPERPVASRDAEPEEAKRAPANSQDTTVRVDTQRLDDIMNMVGELVLVRNRLVRLGAELDDEDLQKAVGNLNVVTADLQTSVMKTRMQPIKKVFGRFPRVVRDLARSLKKEVNLELVGEETDLDKNLVDALADPLVHLVRNSVDHGVEAPDIREAKGKPRTGRIVLSAQQEGDHILLIIQDDGGGMDADKLRGIAVKRGVMDQEAADRLSEKECFNLIFAPGFSTKTEISDVSGRGVGMDVVKTKISQLNGTVDIDSKLDVGTTINIKVPLTLAIMPTLMVMLGNQAFALPLVSVNEIFHLDLSKTNVVDGQEVVIVRSKPIPLYYLSRWLTNHFAADEQHTAGHVVVVQVGTQTIGLVVDQLIGQEEVVIKPLGKMLQGTDGMAGATITGDGRIALILDVPSLLKAHTS